MDRNGAQAYGPRPDFDEKIHRVDTGSVFHDICFEVSEKLANQMKNVTITMSDDLVRQAWIEAAKQGKSSSRFLSDLVEQRVGRRPSQRDAIERFLAAPLLPLTDESGHLPRREELYDDALLRRHEHPRLSKRSKNSSQT